MPRPSLDEIFNSSAPAVSPTVPFALPRPPQDGGGAPPRNRPSLDEIFNPTTTEAPKPDVSTGADVAESVGSGLVRGIPHAIDAGGALVAKGADLATQGFEKLTGVKTGLKTGIPMSEYAAQGGLNTVLDKTVGEEYQPQTTAGKYAKAGAEGVATSALTPLKAATLPGAIVKTVATGAASGVGAQGGGDLGETVGGDLGHLVNGKAGEETGKGVGRVIGSMIGGVTGAAAADKTVNGLVRGMEGEVAGRAVGGTADELKQRASALYQEAADKGGTLSKDVTNSFLANATKKLVPQTEEGRMIAGNTPSTQLAQRLTGLADRPLTLQAAQEIDEHLGDMVDSLMDGGRVTKEAKKVLDLQTEFRNAIENATEQQVTGGKEGFNALTQARDLWSRSARMRDVEKIIGRAELSDQPANAIKSGFKTLLYSPRIKSYTTAEQALIRKAAESGIVGDALRVGASRLVPIISAATGGLTAGAEATAASMAARSANTALQVSRAERIADQISRGGAAPSVAESLGNRLRIYVQPSNYSPPSSPAAALSGQPAVLNENLGNNAVVDALIKRKAR